MEKAYEIFAHAAETHALKVVLRPTGRARRRRHLAEVVGAT